MNHNPTNNHPNITNNNNFIAPMVPGSMGTPAVPQPRQNFPSQVQMPMQMPNDLAYQHYQAHLMQSAQLVHPATNMVHQPQPHLTYSAPAPPPQMPLNMGGPPIQMSPAQSIRGLDRMTPMATPSMTPQMDPRSAMAMAQGTPVSLEDQKIQKLVEMVSYEALTANGDRTREWSYRCVRLAVRTVKKYQCFNEFFDAIMTKSMYSKCCPGRNDKQPGFGRSNMFVVQLFRYPWLRFENELISTTNCRHQFSRDNNQVCLNPYHYKHHLIPPVVVPPIVVNKFADYGEPPVRPEDPLEDFKIIEERQLMEEEEKAKKENEEDDTRWVIPNITMLGDEIKILFDNHPFDPKDPLSDFPMPAATDIQSNMAFKRFEPDAGSINGSLSGSSFSLASMCSVPLPHNYNAHAGNGQAANGQDTPVYRSGLSSPASDIAYSPDVYVPSTNPEAKGQLFNSKRKIEIEAAAAAQASSNTAPVKAKPQEDAEPMEQDQDPEADVPSVMEPPLSPQEEEFEAIPEELATIPSVSQSQSNGSHRENQGVRDSRTEDEKLDDELMQIDEEVRMDGDEDEDEDESRPKRARPTYPDGRPITPIEPKPLYRSSASELGELVRNAANTTFECVEYEEDSRWLGLMYFEETHQVADLRAYCKHHCLIDGFMSTSDSATRFSMGYYSNPHRTASVSNVRACVGRGARLYLLAGEVYIENLSEFPVFVQSICANMKNGFQLNTVSKLPKASTMKVFDMRLFSKQLAAAAEKTYNDVYALSRMCTFRISFVKGWGQFYRRSTVLRSPCWFQCHLFNPMKWIDSVLTCMGAPPRLCTSRS